VGMHALIGYDTVIYYTIGCYACGGGNVDLWRAYISNADGKLHRERLMTFDTRYPGMRYGFAADWERGEMLVAVCTVGYCGGEGPATEDSVNVVLRSVDGGLTWREAGTLPPNSQFVGFHEGQPVAVTFTGGERDLWSSWRVWKFPSGEELLPPRSDDRYFPMMVDNAGLAWRSASGRYLNANGGDILPNFADAGPSPQIGGREPWSGELFVTSMAPGGLVVYGFPPQGPAFGTWIWKGPLTIRGVLTAGLTAPAPTSSARRLYGNVELPEPYCGRPGCTGTGKSDRMFAYEAVLIDLDTATIHPFDELDDGLTGNQNPFLERIVLGHFAQVSGVGDCLNVRVQPTLSSGVLGCYADGVLLSTNAETLQADGVTWLLVRTPDGRGGFASTEFLR